MIKILLVEDDSALNYSMCYFLNKNGFHTTSAANGDEAYNFYVENSYDLIISDIMMDGTDGFELAESIRRDNSDIPIIFITARSDFYSKEKGFHLGIDDYLVKPVDLDELLLRVNAILRRANIITNKELKFGNFTINSDSYSASCNGVDLGLTVREFNLLFKLLSNPGRTFTRTQLLDAVDGGDGSTRMIDVYLVKLREKTADCDGFSIDTVRGLGYKAVLKG